MHGSAAIGHDYDPRFVRGCVCWLRSDLGITLSSNVVATWANQVSGVSGDAVDPGSLGPTYEAGISGANGQALPTLRFNGSHVLQWNLVLSGKKTVAFVVKMGADPGGGGFSSFYTLYDPSGPFWSEKIESNLGGSYQARSITDDSTGSATAVGYGGTSGGLLGTSAAHFLLHTYDGSGGSSTSAYTAQEDSTIETISASSTLGRSSTVASSIGARYDASVTAQLNGDVYEFLVFNRVLSSTEKLDLWGYIKSRYAL